MAKKRVTLPKNFKELADRGDIEGLKEMYQKCELSAVYDGRYGMDTALHYYRVPGELIRWLAAQGLNVDIENYYGRTPLYEQCTVGSSNVELLLELGADIEHPDHYGSRPLHQAARYFRTETVRLLVEKGADVHAENDYKQTPLEAALSVCRTGNIPQMAEVSFILLEAGTKITSKMLDHIKRIGQDFEFRRNDLNPDFACEADAGMQKLYQLFDTVPVEKRHVHDGISPIVVPDETCEKQFDMLWELLVPSNGAAKTVQGEVIRITGRVQDELDRNGGINWDDEYRRMLKALCAHFASGISLSDAELNEVKKLISGISAKGDVEYITNHLCEFAVKWVLKNPTPIILENPEYKR